MGYFREEFHIRDIRPADVDVEEHEIPILLLLLHEIPELRLDRKKGLGEPLSRGDAVNGEVYGGDSCLSHVVNKGPIKEIAVGREIHEESMLGAIGDHIEGKSFLKRGSPPIRGTTLHPTLLSQSRLLFAVSRSIPGLSLLY